MLKHKVLAHLLNKLDNIFHVIFWHYNLSKRKFFLILFERKFQVN